MQTLTLRDEIKTLFFMCNTPDGRQQALMEFNSLLSRYQVKGERRLMIVKAFDFVSTKGVQRNHNALNGAVTVFVALIKS